MIIILEGVDGSGKTTLANDLRRAGFGIVKWERNVPIQYEMMWAASKNHEPVIFDRSFISDMVYRIYDGHKRDYMNLTQISTILDTNVLIVYCKTDTSFEDSMKRGEDNVINKNMSDKLSGIYDNIIELISKFTAASIFRYNWKWNSAKNLIKHLEEYYDIKAPKPI